MKFLLLLLIGFKIFLFSIDDYLSNEEYGRRLFNNPRGIPCSECHGQKGNGGILSAYVIDLKGKKKLEKIVVPKINDINISKFKKTFLDTTSRRYMPTYYLTQEELAYIYYYLQKIGEEEKKAKIQKQKEKKELNSHLDILNTQNLQKSDNLSKKNIKDNITYEDENSSK